MRRKPQVEPAFRVMRNVLLMVIFTFGSLYLIVGAPFPHGDPLLYAVALSWLVAITGVFATGAIWAKLTIFCLARWEKEGEIYGRIGVRAFRWLLPHSALGWINPNLHLSGRSEAVIAERPQRVESTAVAAQSQDGLGNGY